MNKNWDVPEYTAEVFRKKEHEYCVLVFVINEGEKLHKQLERMQEHKVAAAVDIIIADGGSTDGSTDSAILQEYDVTALLTKNDSGKLGAQMRMGFAYALESGYAGVVVIDGNNKDSVENIPDFAAKLAVGYDHVQGSRFIRGGHHENTPFLRLLGLKLLHAPLLSLASGVRQTDTTNGFRAYSKNLLLNAKVAVFRDVFTHYELHYYLALQAGKQGFNICEIPVSRVYPATGKTPTKISPIRGNLSVLKKLFEVIIGKYNVN